MTDFGVRLKESMEKRDINASELSRLSGVGKNLISYYINGKYLAKQDRVYLLAHALGVDPGWLMTGEEPVCEEHKLPTFFSDSQMMVKFTQAMSYEDYKTFIDILHRAEQKLKEKGEL